MKKKTKKHDVLFESRWGIWEKNREFLCLNKATDKAHLYITRDAARSICKKYTGKMSITPVKVSVTIEVDE